MYLLNNKKKIFLNRLKIIFIILSIFLIYLIYNLYILQIVKNKYYNILAKNNYTKIISIIPHRGWIFDKNGIPIAYNKKTYFLEIKRKNIKNIKKEIKKIKNIFLFKKKIIKDIIIKFKNKKKYKNIKINKKLKLKEINIFYKYKKLFPNIKIISEYNRYYPYKDILSHVIGYVIKKKKNYYIGKTGIEKYYQNILYGKNGYKEKIIDGKNNTIKKKYIKLEKAGKNITLSIDLNLQKFIYNLLKKNQCSVIISNCKNGEILSLISIPGYNPNIFIKKNNKEYKKILKNKNKPLINKTIQLTYPPASTIKPYIAIYALKKKIIKKNSKILDPGWWKIPKSKKIFYDWNKWGHGLVNITKSIEESSDIFYYQISYSLGIEKISKWIKLFGYGEKTNIDLPNEKKNFLPNKKWKYKNFKKKWYIGDTISIGIGQGYLNATPIQINKALVTLINNGKSIKPHIIKKINNKKINYSFEKKINNIKKKYWDIIKKAMYGVIHKKNGTAYIYFIGTKYKIAAKSGTAQIISIKNNERYKNNKIKKKFKDHILMNAFLPYENPKFAITIILDHGGNKKQKIGLIMKKITDFIMKNINKYD